MKTSHTIIIGDSRKMNEVPDESVRLIVTSPPYWQIKDYGGNILPGIGISQERNRMAVIPRYFRKSCRSV